MTKKKDTIITDSEEQTPIKEVEEQVAPVETITEESYVLSETVAMEQETGIKKFFSKIKRWFSNKVNNAREKGHQFSLLPAREKGRKIGDWTLKNAIYIIFFVLVVWTEIYSLTHLTNHFLNISSIINILQQSAASMFLALGVGGIIVLTGTDLSAGKILGLSMLLTASLLQNSDFASKMFPNMDTWPIFLVVILVMVVGGFLGAVNGFFVAKFKIHPFIVTLATQLMIYGVMLIYVNLGNNAGQPIAGLDENYRHIASGNLMIGDIAIPYYVFYAIIAIVLCWFLWNKTSFGKNMYAVGANEEAAKVSGVNVIKTIISVFMFAGILYGFSGFIDAARVGSNSAGSGNGAELDAIAACVIGGVSFSGGTGKISGIVVGVVLLKVITIALQWLGADTNLQYIIKGAIILGAVAIDMKKYLVKK